MPIAMASGFFGAGLEAVSTGWGFHARNRDVLHWMTLSSVSNDECRDRLPGFEEVIRVSNLCLLPPQGEAVCDFGNPLVANGQVVAVSIWDAACNGVFPSVHERVAHHRSWIDSVIAEPEETVQV